MKKSKTLLEEHEVRKTKKQKTSFIQHLCAIAANEGYVSEIEQMKSGSRNVVVGNFDGADVIYTAHYDTPSRSLIPTFVTPKMPWLTSLSKAALALLVLIPTFAVFFILAAVLPGVGLLPTLSVLISIIAAVVVFITAMILFVGGPARRDNANSNSSGVRTLLEAMGKIPEELRNKVAFVFLDNQENGYIGAADFAKKHKHTIKNKLVVNFDAVGVGSDVVVAISKHAREYEAVISSAFASDSKMTVNVMQGAKHIPSDHIKFKNSIGVSAFKKTSSGLLYLDKLTTAGDTECSDKNIEFMAEAAAKLAAAVSNTEAAPIKAAEEAPSLNEETAIAEETAEEICETVEEASAEETMETETSEEIETYGETETSEEPEDNTTSEEPADADEAAE